MNLLNMLSEISQTQTSHVVQFLSNEIYKISKYIEPGGRLVVIGKWGKRGTHSDYLMGMGVDYLMDMGYSSGVMKSWNERDSSYTRLQIN